MATSVRVRDATVSVHGLGIHYRVWEHQAASSEDLVLVHGLSSTSHIWDLVAPSLAEHYRVLALDQRGHGESAQPDSGYDYPTIVSDLQGFLQLAEARTPLLLVGHSWGASIVLRYAVEHPSAIAGLVLLDGGTGSPGEHWSWEETLARLTPPDIDGLPWTQLRQRMSKNNPLYADPRIEAIGRSLFRIGPDGRVERRLSIPNHLRILRALWNERPAELLARVRCPVFVLPARQAGDAPERLEAKARAVARAKATQPRVRVRWFEDTMHDVPLQRPAELADELLAFAADVFSESELSLERP